MSEASGRGPVIRGFLSYAHADRTLVDRLRKLLAPRLASRRGPNVSVWWDDLILIGQLWDEEIRRAITNADFGLVLVSPALLASDYVRRVEIPALTTASGTAVMPVGLQHVDLARSDLQGLDAHQIFRYRVRNEAEPKWFADLGGQNPARFCDQLAGQITDRLLLPR